MNHPKSMFQLSGVHCRYPGFGDFDFSAKLPHLPSGHASDLRRKAQAQGAQLSGLL